MSAPRSRQFAIMAVLCMALAVFAAGCDNDDSESPHHNAPPVPSGVISVTHDHAVDIYWNAINGVPDLAGYGVYRSDADAGPYTKLASIANPDSTHFTDDTVQNGVTYFYAVDAFNKDGNESALSVESVYDTPRPERSGLQIFAREADSLRSGVDFSEQPDHSQMIGAWDAPATDIYVTRDGAGALRVVGTQNSGHWNNIQDMGWTSSLDEIGYAPQDGWDSADRSVGFELITGHTYVVWTWDDHYAKFRVTGQASDNVVVDWAYQIAVSNPELSPPHPKK